MPDIAALNPLGTVGQAVSSSKVSLVNQQVRQSHRQNSPQPLVIKLDDATAFHFFETLELAREHSRLRIESILSQMGE